MTQTIEQFLEQLKSEPESISFEDCMDVIDKNYHYSPGEFSNGLGNERITNQAGANLGSSRIFAFAKLNGLDKNQTLCCFGDFYRIDVLQNPQANDHANIRLFMRYGWKGISIAGNTLIPKAL